MYQLKEITEGPEDVKRLVGLEILCNESRAGILRGGLVMTVAVTAAACPDERNRQNFLHGIVLAMSHCAITLPPRHAQEPAQIRACAH